MYRSVARPRIIGDEFIICSAGEYRFSIGDCWTRSSPAESMVRGEEEQEKALSTYAASIPKDAWVQQASRAPRCWQFRQDG